MNEQRVGTRLPLWLSPFTPWGRLNLQAWLNSTMATALVLLQAWPWLAFIAVLGLAALSALLHGKRWTLPFALFGGLGWVGEIWISGLGGVWRFAHPAGNGLDGGLFGVPFYMAPAWAIVGAFAIAVAGVVDAPGDGDLAIRR